MSGDSPGILLLREEEGWDCVKSPSLDSNLLLHEEEEDIPGESLFSLLRKKSSSLRRERLGSAMGRSLRSNVGSVDFRMKIRDSPGILLRGEG